MNSLAKVIRMSCALWFSVSTLSYACELSFKNVYQDSAQPYTLSNEAGSVIELQISLAATNCNELSFMFNSANNYSLVGAGAELIYQLKGPSGRNLSADLAFTAERNELNASSEYVIKARAVVEPGNIAGPGSYTDQLTLKALNANTFIQDLPIIMTLQVNPEAIITMAGQSDSGYSAAAGGGLNFGELKPGKEASAFLMVRSNVLYALNISSRNQGSLVHQHETGEQAVIPYAAWLDNERLLLKSVTRVQDNRMTPSIRSRSHRLAARIEPFTGKLAGNYQDIILVEVVFLE